MQPKGLCRWDTGLCAPRFRLSCHDLFERRKIAVSAAGQLALVAAQHLPFNVNKLGHIHLEVRIKTDHFDRIHPTERGGFCHRTGGGQMTG